MGFSVSILIYFASKLQNPHRGFPFTTLNIYSQFGVQNSHFRLECKFLCFRWLFHLECTTRKIFPGVICCGEVTSPGFICSPLQKVLISLIS